MQILIDDNYNALQTGNNLVAENAYDFIVDTNDCKYHKSVLIEIAKQNRIKLSTKKQNSILRELEEALVYKNSILLGLEEALKRKNKIMSAEITDEMYSQVKEIVDDGMKNNLDEDSIIVSMMTKAKIKFIHAGKLLQKAMEEGGHRASNSTVKEAGRQILVDQDFAPEAFEEIQSAVTLIKKEIDGANDAQVMSVIRSYCKEFEISMPKPPRKVTVPFEQRVLDFIIANPHMSQEDLAEALTAQEKGEKVIAKFAKYLQFGQAFAKSYSETPVPESSEKEEEAA